MRQACGLPAIALFGLVLTAAGADHREAPSYAITGVVNSASNQPGFSAGSFVTIYGTNLAYTTQAIRPSDIVNGQLPTILPGTGVSVYIRYIPAQIFYVSPTQINILIPNDQIPGPADLQVNVWSVYGPRISIHLEAASPALFQAAPTRALAVHADGSLLTDDAPARPGEVIVLYADGLGQTNPQPRYGEIPMWVAVLVDMARFRVEFDGVPVDASRILYAGVSPGFGGLYQINVRVPDIQSKSPEVRVFVGDSGSQTGISIPVRP